MSTPEQQALALKTEGNSLYKARNFDQAADKYQQAYELHKDITYLNNLAGRFHSLESAAAAAAAGGPLDSRARRAAAELQLEEDTAWLLLALLSPHLMTELHNSERNKR